MERTERETEAGGDFLVGNVFQVTHAEHLAATRGKPVDRRFDDPVQVVIEQVRHDRIAVRGIERGDQFQDPFVQRRVPVPPQPFPFAVIHAPVVNGTDHVGLDPGGIIPQGRPVLPDAEQDVLHHVLGPGGRDEQPCIRNQGHVTRPAEAVERAPVPFTDHPDEFPVHRDKDKNFFG